MAPNPSSIALDAPQAAADEDGVITAVVRAGGTEETVHGFVYSTLKQWILSGRLRPGNKLIPQELADAMEVSRTPIRESLERLHQEGYAGRQPRRGYFVVEIAAGDVRDLYETREALEIFALNKTMAAGLAAEGMPILRKINRHYADMFGPDRVLTHERLEVDKSFHLALAGLSGNQFLCNKLEGIFEKLILKRRIDGPGPLPTEAPYLDHDRLLDAIEAQDAARAQALLTAHIRGACDRLLRYLRLEDANRAIPLRSPRRRVPESGETEP